MPDYIEDAPTVPLDFSELRDDVPANLPVNREDAEPDFEIPEDFKDRVPEPALVRGFLGSAVGFVAALTGWKLGLDWIEPVVYMYAVGAPTVIAWLIRRRVTPVSK